MSSVSVNSVDLYRPAVMARLRDGVPWVPDDLRSYIEAGMERQDEICRLFARTFFTILTTGTLRRDLRTIGGLRADELATPQNGSIVFIENPSETDTRTGGVIPFLPEIILEPTEIFPFVHDAPIGAANKYLQAYAGLVKSEAFVFAAHVRPDPFEGVRVWVCGAVGETKEIVLFSGHDRGRPTLVTFADEPRVYESGVSQIVALSRANAMVATRFWDTEAAEAGQSQRLASTRLFNYILEPDGSLHDAQ